MSCKAHRNLTEEDWAIVDFYLRVRDQAVNLTPMGTEDGRFELAPRLEGWIAACDLYGVPAEDRPALVDAARVLFGAIDGSLHDKQAFRIPAAELVPPELVS